MCQQLNMNHQINVVFIVQATGLSIPRIEQKWHIRHFLAVHVQN
jgi:hypothetical protein